MALNDQELQRLRSVLDGIRGIDSANLITRPAWGSINFSAASSAFQSIYEIVSMLYSLPIERLPSSAANQISEALESAGRVLIRINTFAIENSSNPNGERDQMVGEMLSMEQHVYQSTQAWIPFLAYLRGDIPRQLDEIARSVSASKSSADDFGRFIEERKGELDRIVQAAREASAKAGVGHFTQDFAADAVSRDGDAEKWLTRATVSAVLTVAVAIAFFFVQAPDQTIPAIQFGTSKLVILAMLIAVTAWCAGNFKANKHQAVVSRHKAHALSTFQAFVQASDNPAIRDAVLLETTRSIFAHAQTGYLRAEGSSESSSQVVEIIKSSAEAAGKAG